MGVGQTGQKQQTPAVEGAGLRRGGRIMGAQFQDTAGGDEQIPDAVAVGQTDIAYRQIRATHAISPLSLRVMSK